MRKPLRTKAHEIWLGDKDIRGLRQNRICSKGKKHSRKTPKHPPQEPPDTTQEPLRMQTNNQRISDTHTRGSKRMKNGRPRLPVCERPYRPHGKGPAFPVERHVQRTGRRSRPACGQRRLRAYRITPSRINLSRRCQGPSDMTPRSHARAAPTRITAYAQAPNLNYLTPKFSRLSFLTAAQKDAPRQESPHTPKPPTLIIKPPYFRA